MEDDEQVRSINDRPLRATPGYAELIAASLKRRGRPDVHPALIEGWMRLQYGCLDHLDRRTFSREIKIALACHDDDPDVSERLARSEGLVE